MNKPKSVIMSYKHNGGVRDPITTLNNLHIKNFKNPPKYEETHYGRMYMFSVRVNWGSYEGKLMHGKKEAKENAAQIALGAKPVEVKTF